MEKELINKLSAITEEEKRLLSGGKINSHDYAVGDGFSINAARLKGGEPYVFQRPHTRFAPFPEHTHNFVEMVTVVGGSLTHIIDGREICLGTGDILIMNKHVSHSIKRAEAGDLGINIIMSDAFFLDISHELSGTVFEDFASENSKKDGSPMFLHFAAGGQKQIENIIENLLFELTEYTPDNTVMARTVALLFKYLSLKSKKLLVYSTKSYTAEEKRKNEIKEYIFSSYRTATLTELGKICHLSTPYLSKVISESFGKSFKELLLDERMSKAEELVLKSDMPISQIIEAVGYENESYFHREFKKRYGQSPLALRRHKQKE